MPKCQFLFSAVFGFRNPSKEIFSALDEINAQHLIIARSFQNTGEGPEESHRPTTQVAGPAQGGRAPLWFGQPVAPPTPILRLFKPS